MEVVGVKRPQRPVVLLNFSEKLSYKIYYPLPCIKSPGCYV